MPEHLNSREEIEANFKDDSQYGNTWYGLLYRRFRKWLKQHSAFGPRDIHWYHRWRRIPITLFALFGPGESRWENDIMALRSINKPVFLYCPTGFYLSRIQRWCDWSIQLQWPLFIAIHWKYGRNNLFYFYLGAKRDADIVYWFPAFTIGGKWK